MWKARDVVSIHFSEILVYKKHMMSVQAPHLQSCDGSTVAIPAIHFCCRRLMEGWYTFITLPEFVGFKHATEEDFLRGIANLTSISR